jgi:hypothetical protein
MRKQMIENAAFDVATQVRSVEDAIETVLAEMAELQSRMIHCRSVAGIATATGHQAFEHLAKATLEMVSARGAIADCHGVLKETQRFIPGLRAVSFGEGDECPPPAAIQPLRVVA